MLQGKTCTKLCSSIKGYLGGDRKETGIELKLQALLVELELPFVTQKPLMGITVADIYIAPNVVIFADGTYWHSGEQKVKDQVITNKLKKGKYEVLRLSEDVINKDMGKTKELVLKAWARRRASKDI